jgi:hypothetical protein
MATYPPTWPRKAQIFVRSENDRIKLAGLPTVCLCYLN